MILMVPFSPPHFNIGKKEKKFSIGNWEVIDPTPIVHTQMLDEGCS
jgi:hypothetical protein